MNCSFEVNTFVSKKILTFISYIHDLYYTKKTKSINNIRKHLYYNHEYTESVESYFHIHTLMGNHKEHQEDDR
jgi:hypothetical protein